MIIETSSNQFFLVRPTDGIEHAWIGVELRRTKGGWFVEKKGAPILLVRKAGCRVVLKDAA